MKVAILAHSAVRHDAVGNQAAEKAAFFLERGCDVRVFVHSARNLHPTLRDLATEVTAAERDGPAWPFLRECDLVVAEFSRHFPLLDFLPLFAKSRTRIVVDYHSVTPPQFAGGAVRAALTEATRQRGLAWCADWVVAHSAFASDELAAAVRLPRERITSLDLPIEDAFAPCEVRGDFKQRLGIGADRLLLFVGRIAENKRPRLLVEAVGRMREEEPRVHAAFIGDDSDVYANEKAACIDLATRLGVSERVHFLGKLPLDELADAYQSADLFVMPSLHEGFCLPVREAMACGLPVLAARSSALPETVGDAGLTFTPDDVDEFLGNVRRVFQAPTPRTIRKRIALVCFRFGPNIVGGAERSLRTIGTALANQGNAVEVFTTCNVAEGVWKNESPPGSSKEGDLLVHRFPMDDHDRAKHLATLTRIHAEERPSSELAEDYVRHALHSAALLDALERRRDDFDAIIVGPYLSGLTCDVARRFPERTLLLPCFHDEPLAWLPVWPTSYAAAGGILYHTPEEQQFAQTCLGVNHPNASVVGTYMDPSPLASESGPAHPRPYVVYCGRYSNEKNLPRLLDFAERYQTRTPGQIDFLFLGQGEIVIPRREWAHDLGRVDETRKAHILRDALALVQLSERESLSLVVLEAWREGTPVLVAAASEALRGQVVRSGGGIAVDDFDSFATAIDHFLAQPEQKAELGERGRAYVQREYRNEREFAARLERHVASLDRPFAELLQERGLARSQLSSRGSWREAFAQGIDRVLHEPERARRLAVAVHASRRRISASTGRSVLIPLMVTNEGAWPAADRGPGRMQLVGRIESVDGDADGIFFNADLPRLLSPGDNAPAALTIPAPSFGGDFRIRLWCARLDSLGEATAPYDVIALCVTEGASANDGGEAVDPDLPYLDMARSALAEAHEQHRLPDDYVDVAQGWFARAKGWMKQKLLGNFRRAYVDVLSRQQSQVNRQLVQAVQQLTQHCGTLEHAVATLQKRVEELEGRDSDGQDGSSQENDQRSGLPSA